MSRIGGKPIVIPEGVTVNVDGNTVSVKGKNGELTRSFNPLVNIEQVENELVFTPTEETKQARSMHGTVRSLVNNMVVGVTEGFEKKLELVGVGYRAQLAGNKLNLSVGLSHPVEFVAPEGVTIEVPDNTHINIKGYDKEAVGSLAADIRAVRPPEPYKGKGIKYSDEQIIRKEGKTGK